MKQLKQLLVAELIGSPVMLAADKGIKLYEAMKELLSSNRTIKVDFKGCEFLSTTFLNHSLGQIVVDLQLSQSEFEKRVVLCGLDEAKCAAVELAVQNAEFRAGLIKKGKDPVAYYTEHISD